MFQFSRRLALVFGILLPVLETIRRFRQLGGLRAVWPMWLDDLPARRRAAHGRAHDVCVSRYQNARYLAAAWGAACGMGLLQFLRAASRARSGAGSGAHPLGVGRDHQGQSGFALAIVALIGALKQPRRDP